MPSHFLSEMEAQDACSTSPPLCLVKCDSERGRAKNREKGAQHCDAASTQVAQLLCVPFCY